MLTQAEADLLIGSAQLQHALTQVLRIAVDGTLDPANATAGLKSLLVRAGGAEDFPDLERRLAEAQDNTRAAFERLLRLS